MQVQSYLFFNGRCEEAIEFYKKTLGAKVEMLMRFKEAPGDHKCTPGTEEKIMHSSMRIGDTLVMASDGMAQGKTEFKGFSLTLDDQGQGGGRAAVRRAVGGRPGQQPLVETFFSPSFGMLADKFGVGWMVMAEQK